MYHVAFGLHNAESQKIECAGALKRRPICTISDKGR